MSEINTTVPSLETQVDEDEELEFDEELLNDYMTVSHRC